MTKQQAKQLKKNDWVWAYKIGIHGDCFDPTEFTPIHCYVLCGHDRSSGLIKLGRITTQVPVLTTIDKIFLTREEAQKSMLDDLNKAIEEYEHANKLLMRDIEDDLRYNNNQISRLSSLKTMLEWSM